MKLNITRKQLKDVIDWVQAEKVLTPEVIADRIRARFGTKNGWKSAPVTFEFRGEVLSISEFARRMGCHAGYFSAVQISIAEIAKVLERFDTGLFFKDETELYDTACDIRDAYRAKAAGSK